MESHRAPPPVSRPDVGFASRQKTIDHYRKHGREFGSISMEQYVRKAQELRDRPAGGPILESVRPDGVVTRFDRESGDFIAFNRDGTNPHVHQAGGRGSVLSAPASAKALTLEDWSDGIME